MFPCFIFELFVMRCNRITVVFLVIVREMDENAEEGELNEQDQKSYEIIGKIIQNLCIL